MASAAAAEAETANSEIEVDAAWLWIWRAWTRLHVDRRYAGGDFGPRRPEPIAWESIVRWCEWHGYGPDDLDMMDHCVAKMDAEFFAWWREQNPPEPPRGRR